ncbi:MAG: cytochrome c-type biogenesis protein CcmH [Gammaproteobacteria bacterium]|nr:cytochrome c-type biogenesis protein CcmH [Gammaproteobacteria bacterium]
MMSFNSSATEEQTQFSDPVQKELYIDLVKELRCPKCQNQNIADSNAVVAKDMRAKTKELVESGQTKEQVIDYMVARYGQFAHYQPPLNMATAMLWLLPILFITFAVFLLIKRSRAGAIETSNVIDSSNAQTLDKELDALLAKSSQRQKNQSEGEN